MVLYNYKQEREVIKMKRIKGWNEVTRKLNIYKNKTKTLYPYREIQIYYFPEIHSVGAALSYTYGKYIQYNTKAINMTDNLKMILGEYPEKWHNADVKKILREYIEIWENE